MSKDETRTLLVTQGHGTNPFGRNGTVREFEITIPAKAKVTFARVNPQGHADSYALRIYETENNQLAVFTDVLGFRDLSLPIVDIVEEVVTENYSHDDGDGNRQAESEVNRRKKRVAR